jgi:hypothetical protein
MNTSCGTLKKINVVIFETREVPLASGEVGWEKPGLFQYVDNSFVSTVL